MTTEMNTYLSHYGWNFNKRACETAVSLMRKKNETTGKPEPIEFKKKDEVEAFLTKYGVSLTNNLGHNFVYVYHMAIADFYKSSIPDEAHLAKYVKDVIDDPDNPGGNVFRHWCDDMQAKDLPIYWEDFL